MMLASTLGFFLLSACDTQPKTVACEQMELGRAKDECLHSEIKVMGASQASTGALKGEAHPRPNDPWCSRFCMDR